MADTPQTDALGNPSLSDDIAVISATQDTIVERIAALERVADQEVTYPIERVRGSVGRWLIPRDNTLASHYALVTERARDIDFSPANYPGFDAIFTEQYKGAGFYDPMHNNFPKFGKLRDNLATVRNYILELYFPDNSPDDALRIEHLKQIAGYLAEGLTNDRAFLGLIPVHNPFAPYIDVEQASAPDGEGARYLYQKILEMQRHSNWTRPFSALTSMFGDGAYGAWDLSSLKESAFSATSDNEHDIRETIHEEIAELATSYDTLEAKRQNLEARRRQSESASDLDNIGSQLLFSFYQMRDAVEDLASPIKREAIDIAHEILRKLSLKFGERGINTGLSFSPNGDNDALGSSSGVGRLLVRMAGMMRALGDDMMAHPAVAGAHQAMGQLAYLVKMEALHMANAAGDTKLAGSIRGQLSQLRHFAHGLEGKSIGSLMDEMKEGVNALEQKLRATGLIIDGQTIDNQMSGRGSGSQAQAVNTARQQQDAQRNTVQTKQQQGLNQSQQMQASQTASQAQNAVTQMQAMQRAQRPIGKEESLFSQPTVTVKKAPNGVAAMKNANAARKMVNAQINQAMVTAPPPAPVKPPSQGIIDPKMLASLGSTLSSAQTNAATLTSGAIGPKTSADAIRKAQVDKAVKQAVIETSLETQEPHAHTRPPTGRSR